MFIRISNAIYYLVNLIFFDISVRNNSVKDALKGVNLAQWIDG
jgi:hypothetical protein